MTICASRQFAKLFNCRFEDASPNAGEFGDIWYVETGLLTPFGRFVLFSEARTLFTLLIHTGVRRSIAPLIEEFEGRVQRLPGWRKSSCVMAAEPFRLAKRIDRGIIGSQNELVFLLGANLQDEARPLTASGILQIERRLNDTPMSRLQMDSPAAAFQNMAA